MWDTWGGFISLTSIPDISTALMRPRRPKQYCLQLVIYIYIYIHYNNIAQYIINKIVTIIMIKISFILELNFTDMYVSNWQNKTII